MISLYIPLPYTVFDIIVLGIFSALIWNHISVLIFASTVKYNLENSRGEEKFIVFTHIFFFFNFLFMAVLGLRFSARAFSSCGKRGPLFIAVRGPLTIATSLVAEHRLQTRRLSNCGSRAQLLRGMWDLPDRGSNPCPLHWQADSQPLRHQGSPTHIFDYCVLSSFLGSQGSVFYCFLPV